MKAFMLAAMAVLGGATVAMAEGPILAMRSPGCVVCPVGHLVNVDALIAPASTDGVVLAHVETPDGEVLQLEPVMQASGGASFRVVKLLEHLVDQFYGVGSYRVVVSLLSTDRAVLLGSTSLRFWIVAE